MAEVESLKEKLVYSKKLLEFYIDHMGKVTMDMLIGGEILENLTASFADSEDLKKFKNELKSTWTDYTSKLEKFDNHIVKTINKVKSIIDQIEQKSKKEDK